MIRSILFTLCAAVPFVLPAALPVGGPAPDFTERVCDGGGLTGERFTLSVRGEGKVVFLEFNNPACGKCISTASMVEREVWPRYCGNPGVLFVQVGYAYGGYSVEDVVSFIGETGCTQTVLASESGASYAAFEVPSIPFVYVIDSQGTVRYAASGYAGTGPVAAAEMIAAVDAALAGPSPTPLPCLALLTSADAYARGDRVRIEADAQARDVPFDAYALLRAPDGTYLSIIPPDDIRPGVRPFAAGVPSLASPGRYTLLDAAVPPGALPGSYEIIAGLAAPGTLDPLCEASAARTVR